MYLINLDYLELYFKEEYPEVLSVKDNTIYIPDTDICFKKIDNRKYHKPDYLYCYEIMISTKNIGTLYKDHMKFQYNKTKQIICVRIENSVLYEENISEILTTLSKNLKWKLQGVSRLDICIDSDEDYQQKFKQMYYDTSTYSFKYRSSDGRNSKLYVNGTGELDKKTEIGSPKNRKRMIVMYDKTLQLEKGNKPYIHNLHKTIFGHNRVSRLEIRLFNKEFSQREGLCLELDKLNDKSYLEGISKDIIDDMIDFRVKKKNDSNKSRYQKIEFVTLNNTSEVIRNSVKQVVVKNNPYLKYLVKTLDKDSRSEEFSDLKDEMMDIRFRYIQVYGLGNQSINTLTNRK